MRSLTPDETILGLLALRPRHGYELLESFRDSTQLGEVWKLSTSQLYAVLKRLEREGLTEGHEVIVVDAPPRTEYCLTEQGAAYLEAWLNDPAPAASVNRVRVEFLSRLFIARLLNRPTQSIVAWQRAACLKRRDELLVRLGVIEPGIGRLTQELVLAQFDVILQWLDRCELSPKSSEER
jgi:DNA-binding PadR family transcriptional regulator